MYIDIGLNEETRVTISEYLGKLLVNEYSLYLKTLDFHWNITGHSFIGLHQLLESNYEWLKLTIDEIAERIRTMGYTAPGAYRDPQANVMYGQTRNLTAAAMLAELVVDHEALTRQLRNTLNDVNGLHDYASEDMLIQWLKAHEKNTWILRSHLLHTPEA